MALVDRLDFSDSEQALWNAAATGAQVDLRAGDSASDDPSAGAGWGAERTVRATVLYDLLVSQPAPRAVVVRGARINGGLNLEAATLGCPLILEGCYFDGPINLRQARAENICLTGCQLTCVDASQLETRSDLDLRRSTATSVGLAVAHVGGNLVLTDTTLVGGRWPPDLADASFRPLDAADPKNSLPDLAFGGDGLRVDGSVFCEDLTATGDMRLSGARIQGGLHFDGASVHSESGFALTAFGLSIENDALFTGKFKATGLVSLSGARIHGDLDFQGAALRNEGKRALEGLDIEVDGNLKCSHGFAARGEVNLTAAQVHGQLNFAGATLANGDDIALNVGYSEVKGVVWLNFASPPEGRVTVEGARFQTLYDSPDAWPSGMYLGGLTYNDLKSEPDLPAKDRLRWLERDPDGYAPQPYEQLVTFYRRAGREQDARRVAIEKQRRRRSTLSPLGKVSSLLLGATVGHGYRAWFAAVWLLGLWLVGFLLFDRAYPEYFKPAKPLAEIPDFQPALYTLDLLLPIINLHQRDAWIAEGPAQLGALLTVAGWLLATAAIAALTGILKRD